ncbi:acyltransferase [soil metagenome]
MAEAAIAKVADPSGELDGVQILRAFAAMAVVVHHLIEQSLAVKGFVPPDGVILFGSSGVDLFFVISGFIMLYTSNGRFRQSGAATAFLVRRVIRIVPLYWLCTGLVIVLHFAGLMYTRNDVSAPQVLRSLMFLPAKSTVVGVGWTLNYEIYFYLLFTVALALLKRGQAIIAITAALIVMILASNLMPPSPEAHFFGRPMVLEFAYGMGLAWLLLRGYISGRLRWLALGIGLAGLAVASALGPHPTTSGLALPVRWYMWGVPVLFVAYWGLFIGAVRSRIGKLFLLLGDASYSIYLTHSFMMPMYGKIAKAGHLTPWTVVPAIIVMTMVCAAIGVLVYRFIERPITQALKSAWRKQSPGAVAAPSQAG